MDYQALAKRIAERLGEKGWASDSTAAIEDLSAALAAENVTVRNTDGVPVSDKLQAWCEEVLTEYHKSYQSPELMKEFAGELAAILRNRTDFRLIEPLPEGAVPVRSYVCCEQDGRKHVDFDERVFRDALDTHQTIIETHILPRVKTPIVNPEPKGVE